MTQQILSKEKFLEIWDTLERLHGSDIEDQEIKKQLEQKYGKTLYHDISKEDFEKEKQKVLKRLPALSKNELTYEIYRLFALFKDAHTRLYLGGWMDSNVEKKFLDLQLMEIDNKFYIVGINKENKNLLLKEIQAINDVPINKLIKKAKPMIPAETEQYKRYNLFSNSNFKQAHFLKALGLNNVENGVKITVDNKLYDVTYNSGKFVRSDLFKIPYSYGFERKNGIGFLGYYISSESKDYPIKDFCQDLDKNLKKEESIIVDLRGNPGGKSLYFEQIVEVLKKKQINGCFLTDGGTFSAGTWAAMECKKLGLVNIGEEWGEPIRRFGDCPNITEIPELDLCFTVSERYFDLGVACDVTNATNKPDIEIHNTIEDYRNNYDRVLETAIACIKENELKEEKVFKK